MEKIEKQIQKEWIHFEGKSSLKRFGFNEALSGF